MSFSDWPNQPNLLIGQQVEVELTSGKSLGIVSAYNSSTKQFTILFGKDEKQLDFFAVTFKIGEDPQIWTPEYSRSKIRNTHVSTTPRLTIFSYVHFPDCRNLGSSLVYFSVVIDPQLLEEGDRIVINGNLPQLTNWQNGIPLIPSETFYMWSATIELPFFVAESNPYGLFRYRYEIVTRNGIIPEGNLERSEQVLRTHYYHYFRGNFRSPRFRGWVAPQPKQLFQYFCRLIVAEYVNGLSGLEQTFKKYANLMSCFPDAHRSSVEALFEESLQGESPYPLMLSAIYLGFIGAFGLTSEEKVYVAGNGNYTHSYVGGVHVSNPTPYGSLIKRKPPKPTSWVFYCALELDVINLYKIDWAVTFGPSFRWISRGIVEAIERLSEHNSYDWLKIIPFASKFNFSPRIVHTNLPPTEVESLFLVVAKRIFLLATEQLSCVEVPELDDNIGLGNLVQEPLENDSINLARDWLKSIVIYAPSLTTLSNLFLEIPAFGAADFTQHSKQLRRDIIAAFKSKIENEEMTSLDLQMLEGVLINNPFLQSPEVAAALFKNFSCDSNTNQLVHMVKICLEGKQSELWSEPYQQSENNLSGLEGIWHELNTSAKEFLSRKHGSEPPSEMVVVEAKKDYFSGWGFSNWVGNQYPEKKPKRLTEEEIRQQYNLHMNLALLDIDLLLTIPFFASNPNGLLFEFGRCWFMKSLTIQQSLYSFTTLCFLASKNSGFRSFHPQLAYYLEDKILKQQRDIASEGTTVKSALHEVTRSFISSSLFAHQVLYKFALLLTWPEHTSNLDLPSNLVPPLKSILQNSFLWIELRKWTHICTVESPLVDIIISVAELLSTTTQSINELSCNLQNIHIIMENLDIFVELAQKYNIQSLNSLKLNSIIEEVQKFDVSLEQLQVYVSFYCTCGVKINATTLRQHVENLRNRYEMVQLNELSLLFLNVPIMPFVPWLYHLRGSELFLQEWRRIGREICIDAVEGARALLEQGSSSTSDIIEPIIRDVDEDDQTFSERIDALEVLLFQQTRAVFEEQDRRNETLKAIEAVELTQDVVIQHFIPAIQTQWSNLAKETFSGQLTLSKLNNTFSNLIANEEIVEELKLLLSTSDLDVTPLLLEITLSRIKDYYFLRKLYIWLPDLLRLHKQLEVLHCQDLEQDPFRRILTQTHEKIVTAKAELTLATIPLLISDVRALLSQYSNIQLDFLSALSSSSELIQWLLSQSSTEEFNKLLQVVRPCTDEPRMLSAIASLVHVRTLLIQVLYINPPYDSLEAFLKSILINVDFNSSGDAGDALWHLNNIVSNFESLMDVFQKQTRSPGIKACFDLQELHEDGIFVLKASSNLSHVLCVEFYDNGDPKAKRLSQESFDYLYDLRSKLLMTEIPPELDEQFQASTMVEEYIQQLQVLSELSDVVVNLHVTGHIDFQEGFEIKFKFKIGGVSVLKENLLHLEREFTRWEHEVKTARLDFYYLNFFTMRELLRIRQLITSAIEPPSPKDTSIDVELPLKNSPTTLLEPEIESIICQMEQMGFSREWSLCAIGRSGKTLESAVDFCLSYSQMMDRYVAEDFTLRPAVPTPLELSEMDFINNAIDELHGLLHLVSSTINITATYKLIDLWKELTSSPQSMLSKFGSIFATLFDVHPVASRCIPYPDEGAQNKADMLILLDDENEKKLPLFVTCTQSPLVVIETVLSVYIRRGRLPEPGEVIFCTNETTLEDLNLLLMRYLFAKQFGRGEWIFCIADLQNLSYTLQCKLVERIRLLFMEHGSANAATLLLVSGLPKQVALNTLSSHAIDLPPLDLGQLRKSCSEAFRAHCGHTECVASTINGGGKSHYVMTEVANRQLCDENIFYQKIALRESTNPYRLVTMLSLTSARRRNTLRQDQSQNIKIAFHLDIAHIIPASANTMLFQLLLIGVLRCPISCRVMYRNPADMYFIEVPNSPNNKTAIALRFCHLLPHSLLTVSPESLQFTRPVIQPFPTSSFPVIGTAIILEEYLEMEFVCKWLRAINSGKIQYGGSSYDPSYSPWTDLPITKEECFELLCSKCCQPGSSSPYPSWSLFHSVIVFMNMQFSALEKYPLLQNEVLTFVQGLENFKHVFIDLLVETSIEFSLRSVPQLDKVGPPPGCTLIVDEDIDDGKIMELSELPPAPLLRLETSSELRRVQELSLLDPPIIVRQSSEEVVRRFQKMISWEESDHPIVLFKMDMFGDVHGVDILSLNCHFVDRYIHGDLKRSLEENHFDFNRDWSNISNEAGVQLIRNVEGLTDSHRGGIDSLEAGYVMTVDNILKMLIIQLRLRFNLPVVIMGETGCGKSTLIRNMCAILGTSLHILNIHGGMEDDDIIQWMSQKIALANKMIDPTERIIVLLDEINTCNCMGLFKEIVCDRSVNGEVLPHNLKIIAACNPYRLRTAKSLYGGEEMAGLAYEHFVKHSTLENVGTGIRDPLRNLVYRVHPLPESIIDRVFDFGALSAETEGLYVRAMLRKRLGVYYTEEVNITHTTDRYIMSPLFRHPNMFDEFVEVFSELVCEAQECIRRLSDGERSAASLRDVSRCVQVFIWFGEHFTKSRGHREGWDMMDFYNIKPKAHKDIRRALILSLAYCYYARLPREERRILVNSLTSKWRSFQINVTHGYPYGILGTSNSLHHTNKAKCRWLNLDYSSFVSILEETQREFVSMMNLGDGIALNEALCENLFMILCSVLNQIPIFVIGKPGSSKSLAMGLIQSNLNGEASDNEFLRSLPAVEVFSYQCSPLSTSSGIEQVFESARRYKREAPNTVVVILLDEVGLAEQSPHLPLKVLHKMLDESGGHEAVVGISNWSLDPAKMNRAVHLYRPAPTVDDLSITAEGMVRSANLKGYLHELARAYNEIYHSQNHPDFWGLREFYSTVKAINNSISYRKVMSGNDVVALDSTTLLSALLRNFGGRPQEIEKIVECFFTRLGLPIPALWKDISTEDLIKRNLLEPDARHLMLLTKNNAALSLLLDRSILRQDKTEIIFGSDFPLDQNDLQVCINIQKVKLCMAEGITTVLVHCESLYESLYDLLNQHYVSYGGQIYVRLAFGTYTRLCPIDKNFRIIVIVEKEEAYTRLAPPLLNRFEKQVFERSSVLLTHQKQVLRRLQRFCHAFSSVWESKSQISWSAYRATFAGYHSDMLSSLILALDSQSSRSNSNEEIDSLFLECVKRLLWICTPEATCRLMTLNRGQHAKEIFQEFGVDCAHEYFQVQCHSSVFSFMDRMLYKWCDRLGTQATWITYSPLTRDVSSVFEKEGIRVTHVVLHELGQERELRQLVSDFFKHAESNSMLLLQCDPLATSRRRIEHSKFLVELMRVKRLKLLEGLNEHELPFCDGQESKDNGKKIAEPSLNIHVILLIHLPRSDSSESMFNIDFDSRWRVAFLDLVHNDDIMGLPSIESLIGKSLSEIFMSLDTQKVLTKTFRTSLSKLVYLYDRSNDDVRKQIFTLTKCLSQPLFIELVRTVISELIKQQFSVTDFELMNLALGTRELHLTGSFQGAIHRQILGVISTLFAVVLSQMDRNNNLSLFLEEDLSQSWIYLFNQSVNVSSLLSKIKWRKSGLVKEEVVEVRSDSYLDSAPFSSRYPFSFFLIPMVETMRRLAEDRGESFLQRHLSSMCFAHGVFEPMDNISISNFIYDFTCMKCREISNLPRSRQAEIVFHMLQHANSQSDSELQDIQNFPSGLTLISQIHFRFWKCERIMELYFDIMNCNIVPLEVFIHYLFEINSPISCSTHFGLLQLVICYLTPMQNSESCQSAYKLLFRLMNSIRSYYHALVDLLEDDSMKFLSMISWKKLEFFRTFLRDVCIPLDLSLEYVQTILPQFPDPYLATSTVLRKVLGLLNHLSFGDGVSYELLCPITLEKLQDPVIASDGFTYERSAIEEWFLSGKLTSPSTNEFLPNQMLVSNHYLKTKLLQHTNADLLKFFEYYVNDILFSHLYREKLDYQVIEDLIFFISGSKVSDIEPSQCLSPGERFIEGVLRQVFKSSNPKDQHHLNVCLELKLRECANKFGYLDTPLSMAYVIVREEFLKNSEPTFPSSISSLNFSVRDIENFRVLLELVAQIRNIFERYANILVTALESPDHSTEISSAINFFTPIVCSILEDPLSRPLTRLLRMYFLKLFGRTRGLSFVRDGLLQSPLRDSRWVLQWRASEDAGFTRFLGSNRLPKINPFVSYPLFTVVHDAFCSFIQSGDMAEFDAKITHIKGLSSGGLCGNLLLASFHELGLLALLPTDRTANLKNKISNFERWVLNPSGHLHNVPESYRKVIITLGLGRMSSFAETCPTLLLDETTPTEVIFRIRFSVHLVAVAMLFDSQYHPLRYIHSLVFCPELLQDNFFPTMPQDLTKMAQNVMGGRWYACPNNHPFYVDLCGRPTLIQNCAECGAQIGGENHNLLETNKDLGNVGTAYYQTTILPDNSEKNYCGRHYKEESEDRYYTTRSLSATSVRLLRVIINTSLSCGASLFGATWCEKALLFMNPNYNHPDNLSNFFVDNVTNDWGLLRSFLSISMDDVALLLHLVLSNSAASDYQSSPISFPSQNESDKSFSSMTHPAVRDYWEEFMDKQHISPLTCTKEMLHEKLTMANRMYGDSAELDGVVGLFANELQERVPLQAIEFSERCAIAPGLWRLAVSFSYEDFVMTLKQLTDGSERYPLLSLITNEDQHQLAVLRHIPAVIEWFRLLRVHYNGSIDRETSRLKVNEAVLDELSHGSTLVREKLDSLFHAYCLAWNDSWSNVLRFGCIKFSSDYNSLRMDLNTPLSFSLPNEFDEGNCPLSLIHYLIEKHNTFAQRVDESLLLRSRAKTVSSENLAIDRVPIISSRFMTSAHTIRCDITQDLLPLLEKHCVLHDNQSGFLGYDFAKAETLIIDRFLSDIPAIDLEMPGFRFAHENFLHGGMIVLRQKIKQHLLPQDIIRLIQREILTPVVAQQFIDLVEQAVSFISTTGGTLVQTLNENVGDMSLGQYMKSVLLLDDINVTISRVISDQIQLKHLDALWNLLTEMTTGDIFSGIHLAYKAPLLFRLALTEALKHPKFHAHKVLAAMKSFMLDNLQEQTIAPSVSIHICLVNMELDGVFLGDSDWFVESFPESVTMAEIVECFEFIKEGQLIE